MKANRPRLALALTTALLVGCSQGTGSLLDEERDASAASLEAEASPEARAVLTRLERRLAAPRPAPIRGLFAIEPALQAPPAREIVRRGERLMVRASPDDAEVSLPVDARGAFRLTDEPTGVAIEVSLRGTRPSEAEVAEGHIVYRGGAPSAGDIVHRPSAEGTEDFILFEEAPGDERLDYEVALGERVSGLRLVENTLELLDEGGAPRLRVEPPYVLGADEERHDATLSILGCAYDSNPAAPWGRATVSPGASTCTVRVSWEGQGVSYPAVVDPAWTKAKGLITARSVHTTTLLEDGRLLVVGGYTSAGVTATAEIYDPSTNSWASTQPVPSARAEHTATLLTSGKVLVVGGYSGTGTSLLSSGSVYDPSSGGWSSVTNFMGSAREAHMAVRLNDGSVLIAGGDGPLGVLASAERYLPSTNSFVAVSSMNAARKEAEAVLLGNGRVLVSGGVGLSNILDSAELYNPASGTFTTTPGSIGARANHSMTVLPSGKVFVFGGEGPSGAAVGSSTIYDPATNAWSSLVQQGSSRYFHTATLFGSDKVLIAGGHTGTSYVNTAVLYTIATNSTASTALLPTARAGHTATRLPSGAIALIGGTNGTIYLDSVEIFADAQTCTKGSDCSTGYCADGYCCAEACGPCGQCNLPGKEGICQRRPSTSPGSPSCSPYVCNGYQAQCPTSCTKDGDCASGLSCRSGQCQKRGLGEGCTGASDCQSGLCVDGVCCNSACAGGCDRCNLAGSLGVCTNAPPGTAGQSPSCGAYLCNGTSPACPTSCVTDASCAAGTICKAGQCVGKLGNGQGCASANDCVSGFCADGVCCGSACDGGSCQRCDLPGSLGVCKIAPLGNEGKPASCAPYVCNGASAACPSSCTGDANCSAGFSCISGICQKKKANGEVCTSHQACESGICADGVCCDKACGGACESCKLPGAMGRCELSPAKSQGASCGLYLCDGASSACPSSCTDDEGCDKGYCHEGRCYPKADDGTVCLSASDCKSGFCVDGTCCESACEGQCARCDTKGALGECRAVEGHPVGGRPACAGGGTSCGGICDGADLEACSYPGASVVCGAASCEDGVAKGVGSCDGAGACAAKGESCAPYGCDEVSCKTSCATASDCSPGAECVDGACRGGVEEGGGDEPSFDVEGDGGGCGCRVAGAGGSTRGYLGFASLALGFAALRRRRRATKGRVAR